jgi:transposase
MTDDFGGYNKVKNVTRVGCLAHARRYYTDAIKALPKEARIESTRVHEALAFFRQMFRLEKQWAEEDLTLEERYEQRILKLKPVMEAYLLWLQTMQPRAVPKSKFGKAVAYSLSNWELMTNILKDGQCELSSNLAEQMIRPFAVGRRNYLFCKTPHGAKASAVIYSIVGTAKLNGLNPYHYLKYLMEQLPNTPITSDESLDHLLPWSETLPEECRSTINKE